MPLYNINNYIIIFEIFLIPFIFSNIAQLTIKKKKEKIFVVCDEFVFIFLIY